MAQAQHSDLTRSERNALSPEQWKANHARSDAEKLVNPPPSLQGFYPDKPPPPKLAATPTGKVAAHVAHAPLTHSLGDKLRNMLPGETTHIAPLVVVTSKEKPVVEASNDTPEPPAVRVRGPQRSPLKGTRVVLSARKRRTAVVEAIGLGLMETCARYDLSQAAVSNWVRAIRMKADGTEDAYTRERAHLVEGADTREGCQAILDEAEALKNAPEELAPEPEPAPEPSLAEAVEARDESRLAIIHGLREQLSEREATLAGYKHELEKLRAENAMLTKHNDTLRAVSEALAGRKR